MALAFSHTRGMMPPTVPAPMAATPIWAMGIVTDGDAKVTGPNPIVTVGVIVVMPLGCTISCEMGVPLMVTPLASILIWASMPSGPTLSVMLSWSILIWVRGTS